jgi:hypothetical protein
MILDQHLATGPSDRGHVSANVEETMSLKDLFQEALNELEWEDEILHDEDVDTDYINTSYGIDGQSYRLQIVTDEDSQTIRVMMMSPIRIPKARMREAAYVLNFLNTGIRAGNLQMSEDGSIHYRWNLDVEGSTPSTKQFVNMISAGAGTFDEIRCTAIGTAAFTKQPAEDIFKDLNAMIENRRSSSAEAPSSL